jgi:prevent-host-death family protein
MTSSQAPGVGLWTHCASVCYMSEGDHQPVRVGVRELRQNLSIYLDRVKEGETLEVTEHGHPVARLTPRPPQAMSELDRLIADGRVTLGTRNVADLGPPPPVAGDGPSLSNILQEMRDEDDR